MSTIETTEDVTDDEGRVIGTRHNVTIRFDSADEMKTKIMYRGRPVEQTASVLAQQGRFPLI